MTKTNDHEAREKLLTRREAAAFLTERGLPISPKTLASRASRGNGPEYEIFLNRAVYKPSKLLGWADRERKYPK